MFRAFYSDTFPLPLPPEHRFPMAKYRLLRQALLDEGLLTPEQLAQPPATSDAQLRRAHTGDYLERLRLGQLSRAEIRRIGFPWSPEMVERSRRSTGGTIAACRTSLTAGSAANLAGGTHHAHADWGQGYCVFNDVVVAARAVQAEGLVRRVLFVDCDVHQGNGTAALSRNDPTLFAFSIHGEKNFPFHKEPGDLDIALPDGTGNEVYLESLARGLAEALRRAQAGLVIYLAGADPYHRDRFGRLALTKKGLAERDRTVYDTCRRHGLPVATVMAGGYAPNVHDIVAIHAETVRQAAGLAVG